MARYQYAEIVYRPFDDDFWTTIPQKYADEADEFAGDMVSSGGFGEVANALGAIGFRFKAAYQLAGGLQPCFLFEREATE